VRVVLGGLIVVLVACEPRPPRMIADSLPELMGDAVPFRYPMGLYTQGVEGDVTLRLHVDSTGAVVAESLRVAESSGQPLLDSAAMEGAPVLRFRPAKLGGRAVPLTVLFPVKFRVPSGTRAPTDTSGPVPGR
jgi:TonB family protein